MEKHCFILLLICCNVLCDDCVVFNFEDSIDDFTNGVLLCVDMPNWNHGRYTNIPMNAPHTNSTNYVAPKSTLSCMSSSTFSVTSGGVLEVKLYMEPESQFDMITLLAFKSVSNGGDVVIANAVLSAGDPKLIRGWQILRAHVIGLDTYSGYITLLGVASESSVILIDSIRYIAPWYDEDLCQVYENDIEEGITIAVNETTSVTTTGNQFNTSTISPDITTDRHYESTSDIYQATTTTTSETTTESYQDTTMTNSPDATTKTYPSTSTLPCLYNLCKNYVRVNVNININKK